VLAGTRSTDAGVVQSHSTFALGFAFNNLFSCV